MGKNRKIYVLIECAILIALSTVLSLIEIPMPFGGGITAFSMVPILFLAYRHGIKWGLASGFVYALIQLMLGWGNVMYAAAAGAAGIAVCIVFDYILAFTVLGLAGVFKYRLGKPGLKGMIAGIVLAVVLRFTFHVLSGGFIWYELTKVWEEGNPDSMVFKYGAWMYSLVYNGIYMGPELISSLLISPFTFKLTKMKGFATLPLQ